MKRVAILFVLAFAWCGSAVAQASRAKDNLQVATKTVLAYAPDAQLMIIQSVPGSTVNPDGICPVGWMYCYISLSKDSLYLVEFNGGQAMVLCNSAANSTYTYCGAIDMTGAAWMNSDSAVSVADENGGDNCRSEHAAINCLMMLGKDLYAADTSRIVWRVIYSEMGEMPLTLFIDPVTGKVISNSTNGVGNIAGAPFAVQLNQNYPNPCKTTTAISFTMNTQQHVSLSIYNNLGEQVATLANTTMGTGTHSIAFDASNLPEGVYFYQLTAGSITQTRRMLVVN